MPQLTEDELHYLVGRGEKGYELGGNWGRRGEMKPDQVMQDF